MTGNLQLAGRAGWGLADQVMSSLTNFGLGILIARRVSPEDFGGFSLAFATFLVVLNISRAVSTEPLLIRYSATSEEAWRDGTRRAAGASLATGLLGSVVCLAVAALTHGSVQAAYASLAVVLPLLLLQDCWRFALVAKGRPSLTFLVDLAWAVVLLPLLVAVEVLSGEVTVVAPVLVWGASAGFSALIGAYLAKAVPRPTLTLHWLREHRDLIPRFVTEAVTGAGAGQVVILAVGGLVGLAGAGAIRAGQLLLGPMQVMFMAATLIAVPEAVRILQGGLDRLVRACILLAAAMSLTVMVWTFLLLLIPENIGRSLLGVAGAGHHDVLELVCGMRRPDAGSVTLPSGKAVPHGLRRAIRAGVALVSGDRRRLGLMLDKPLWENIGQIRSVGLAADGPIVRAGRLRERARAQIEGLRIRSRSVDQLAGSLSGGNQQKVVFAKWLDAQPSVILLDDPTRGVDVGAKAEMHALISSAAAAGAPVLICSTDIDELASLCDRVVVLRQGRVSATLSGDALTTHAVLEAMNTDVLEPAA